jgi:hypothetical protein
MKNLAEYMCEAIAPKTGIGAFDWSVNIPTVVIDSLVQQLPGYGFKATGAHVQNNEYKVSHDGACLTIGVRARAEGEGSRTPSCKIFVRHCNCGRLSIVEKFLNIDGDGKATYKTLTINGDKFTWTPCDVNDLPRCGNIEDTAEVCELLIKKIVARSKRYTK